MHDDLHSDRSEESTAASVVPSSGAWILRCAQDDNGTIDDVPRCAFRHFLIPRLTRAFTIVEVTMAVFILALALTTSLAALQRAFLQLDTARHLEIAPHILQIEMEKERPLTPAHTRTPHYAPATPHPPPRH